MEIGHDHSPSCSFPGGLEYDCAVLSEDGEEEDGQGKGHPKEDGEEEVRPRRRRQLIRNVTDQRRHCGTTLRGSTTLDLSQGDFFTYQFDRISTVAQY